MFNLFRKLILIAPLIVGAFALAACATSSTPSVTSAATPTAVPTTLSTPTPTPAPTSTPSQAPTAKQEFVLQITSNPKLGAILTDAQGMTLYEFKNDTPDKSDCTGDCAKTWLPLTVPQGVTPISNKPTSGNIGVIERSDKSYQVLYNDMPLYRYSNDKKPGDVNGNGESSLWSVIVLPPATTTTLPQTVSATDWTKHNFPTILTTQEITPTYAINVTAGPYTIFVPANTFNVPVKFAVLSGTPATFQAQAPKDQSSMLAFAFNVRDAKTNALITKFDQPVLVTVRDSAIQGNSGFYNISANGNYVLNMTGIQEQSGELTQSIAGTDTGWVITTPSSPAMSTTPQF